MTVRSGFCKGGPKDRQMLVTESPGQVRHPDDPNGFYVYTAARGTEPSGWIWIQTNRKEAAE